MHISSLLKSIAAVSLMTGTIAAPNPVPETKQVVRRSVGSGQILAIVQTLNHTAVGVAANISQALVNVSTNSPTNVRYAAAQKVNQQLAILANAVTQGIASVNQQANSPAALALRQSPGHNETTDLINALGALVTLIDTTIIQVVTAIGLTELVPPIMSLLGTISNFFLLIAAVVIDFLPFLAPIGTLLSGIGSIISGIGSLIPKGA